MILLRVLFPKEMKEVDEKIIRNGIPSFLLMEHAARSVAETVLEMNREPVTVLCGTGNNGGDGYALARLLRNAGIRTSIVSSGKPKTEDAILNRNLFIESAGKCFSLDEVDDGVLHSLLADSSIVIDALFGTGFSGALSGRIARLVEVVNSLECARVAVDIPSGVDGSSGRVDNLAFQAHKTVTFGAPKVGHFYYPGKHFTGELVISSWGFPQECIDEFSSINLLSDAIASSLLPSREQNSHKGTYGAVLVVGGSQRYAGAPVLAAEGALRTGAGLVYCFVPYEVLHQVRSKHPEVIAFSGRGNTDHMTPDDIADLEEVMDRVTAVVIGPGVGRNPETGDFVKCILSECSAKGKGIIVDADALFHYSNFQEELKGLKGVILTPHPGEFSIMTGKKPAEVKSNISLVREYAERQKVAVLLKDATTTFVSDRGHTWISCRGNSGLAKGGSGDLLSGAIAGFYSQTRDLEGSVLLGAYFLGKSAESCGLSEAFMQPVDVASGFDKVFKELQRTRDNRGSE